MAFKAEPLRQNSHSLPQHLCTIELHKVKVWLEDDDGSEGEVFFEEEFEKDEVIVESGHEWETPTSWTHISEGVPTFKKAVYFTVKPEIMYSAESEIEITDLEMPVASLSGPLPAPAR